MGLQIASLYASVGADTKGFEQGAAKVKGGLGDMASQFKSVLPMGITQFLSLGGAVTAVAVAIKDSIDVTTKYVDEVSQLSRISGESTENTSRFVQVLDDYKISADDALVATRKLTEHGYAPSIETLAMLSDKYLALGTAQERNKFVLDNLGRSGLQWVEVLQKGSKSIREQGAAVEDNLLVTAKMRDDVRKNEIAWDNWNDSIQGTKVSLGQQFIPPMTAVINHMTEMTRATEILKQKGVEWMYATIDQKNAAMDQAHAENEAATALKMNSQALDDNAQSAEAAAAAAKALSDINRGQLSLIDDMKKADEDYQDTKARLEEERLHIASDDLEALTNNSMAVQANEEAHRKANLEIMSGLVERKLLQDGILDDKEFEWLIKKRQEWGIYTAEEVANARAVWMEADKITASFANMPSTKNITITVDASQATSAINAFGGSGSVPYGPQPIPGEGGGTTASNFWDDPFSYGFGGPSPADGLFSQGFAGMTPPQLEILNNANTSNVHAIHAQGGSFMIPSSYGNEGFRLGNHDTASAGEMVTITPRGQTPGGPPAIDYDRLQHGLASAVRDALLSMGVFSK